MSEVLLHEGVEISNQDQVKVRLKGGSLDGELRTVHHGCDLIKNFTLTATEKYIDTGHVDENGFPLWQKTK